MKMFEFKFIRLGFKSYTTIAEVAEIFPELDFVDHNKRKELLVIIKVILVFALFFFVNQSLLLSQVESFYC